MVYFFIGLLIGGTAGLFTGCLMAAAKESDKQIESLAYDLKDQKNSDL